MTQVGHSIAGIAVATMLLPRGLRPNQTFAAVLACVILANAPDIPLAGWGHDRYDISHSIFVNLGLISLFATLCWFGSRKRIPVRVILAGVLAWLSHLLLDTFYNHGHGLSMFWPVSDANLALPIPCFETLKKPLPHIDGHTIRVWTIEFAFYGGILLAAMVVQRLVRKQDACVVSSE